MDVMSDLVSPDVSLDDSSRKVKRGATLKGVDESVLSIGDKLIADKELLSAIPGLDFDQETYTSGLRDKSDKDSGHEHGKAVDIRLRNI